MSKRYKLIFSAILVVFVAIVAGACFVFFGNDEIKVVPNSLSVEKIDGKFYLVAEYNANYQYRFSIEKKIDNAYYLVDNVKNDTNSLNLSEQNITINAGDQYRFSVCYTTKNDLDGKKSQSIQWQPTWSLNAVDKNSIEIDENNIMTWNSVYLANSYELVIIDDFGGSNRQIVNEAEFNLSPLRTGHYNIYIRAMNSENQYLTESIAICKSVVRQGTNVILDATYADGVLEMIMTQNATKFEIEIDGVVVAQFTTEPADEVSDVYNVVIENASYVLADVDFSTQQVKVRSLDCEYISRSQHVGVHIV